VTARISPRPIHLGAGPGTTKGGEGGKKKMVWRRVYSPWPLLTRQPPGGGGGKGEKKKKKKREEAVPEWRLDLFAAFANLDRLERKNKGCVLSAGVCLARNPPPRCRRWGPSKGEKRKGGEGGKKKGEKKKKPRIGRPSL